MPESCGRVKARFDLNRGKPLRAAMCFLRFCVVGVVLASLLAVRPVRALEADPSLKRDAEIDRMLAEVSPARIETSIRQLAGFRTRHSLSDTTSETIGIGAARRWIKAELDNAAVESGGRLQVAFDVFQQPPTPPRLPQGAELVNVIATLPGRQPGSVDRLYVVSGHYDSRSLGIMDTDTYAPGANDDASGTAVVMELARVLSRYEFDATIIFMAVAAEEQGLQGAGHWARQAREKNLNIAAMFTNDIVGNTTADDGTVDRSRVRLFAEGVPPVKELSPEWIELLRTGGENDSPARLMARHVKEVAARYVPRVAVDVVYRRDRYLRGGDHSPFLDAGFTALRFTEPNEVYARQHQDVRVENGVQYGDLPQYVDFDYAAEVARINASTLAVLARAPAAPTEVKVETTRLENDTALVWAAGTEPDLAGYRIVWRETTSPVWQWSAWAGKVTRFVVKGKSKDNYLFGVQAVDADGHASQAVYPRPLRAAVR